MDQLAPVHPQAVVQGEVEFGKDVQVWPGSVIKGPCSIGDNAVILENAVISGSDVGEGCILSPRCVIVDSVLGRDCLVGPGSRVIDGSKLGDCCVVEAGVLIRGLGFDGRSVIGGDPPGTKGFVDDDQTQLLVNKREEFKKKFSDYGALKMLGLTEDLI